MKQWHMAQLYRKDIPGTSLSNLRVKSLSKQAHIYTVATGRKQRFSQNESATCGAIIPKRRTRYQSLSNL